MKPLISVVMPVYNQEKFLGAAIESVVSQSFNELELILVDDGSSDGSLKICREAAAKDSRIRVIRKLNGGVSSARNKGLSAAKGDYIGFVDADDVIEKDFYKNMYQIAVKNGCDLVSSSYYSVQENDPSSKKQDVAWFDEVNMKLGRDKIFSVVLPAMFEGFDCPVWNKLYKREIIERNKLRFKRSLRIGEDYLFALEYIFHAKSYYYTTTVGYNYFLREGSAMQTIKSDYISNYLRLFRKKKRLIRKFADDSEALAVQNRLWLLIIGEDFLRRIDGMSGRQIEKLRDQAYEKMVREIKEVWQMERPQ